MPIKKEYQEFFKKLNWPDIKITANEVSVPSGKILELKNSEYFLNFFWYNRRENKYEERSTPQVVFKPNFNVQDILYINEEKYKLSFENLLKRVIGFSSEIKQIKIDLGTTGIKMGKAVLTIDSTKLLQIIKDLRNISSEIKKHKDAISRYFVNKTHNKYFKKQIKDTTTIKSGTFKFVIDRFNLGTKKSKKNYLEYLNEDDISSLEILTENLIKNNIFSEDYLRILDDYFIKEKLKNIIELGKKILSLKTGKLNTVTARDVIRKIIDKSKQIKKLENIWQKYFEKNLLYLVFSYKKIYPKVKLSDIKGDKKYPDFIGINHYNGVDIIEIKTHLANILVWDSSHKNFSFSSEMSKAIIQTMNYLDAIIQRRFQDPDSKDKITTFTDEENLYHPRGIIVISSIDRLTKTKLNDKRAEILKRDFTKLRNSLQNIEILTFDEVLQIADDYIKNIRTAPKKRE